MSCKQVSLSIEAPLVNQEGFHLPGLFEWKCWYIWVPFLDPEDIKILNLGAIWNFGKGTGLSWSIYTIGFRVIWKNSHSILILNANIFAVFFVTP